VPLAEVHREWKQHEWYDVASGKGVMLLAALRTQLGGEAFDKALDEFGRAHAGQHVAADDFRAHLEKTAGHSLASLFDSWMVGKGTLETPTGNFWSIDSFEAEPERALVVYGTLQDRQAQREAAELLARKIARRGSNVTVSVKADHEATDADLNEHHVLLVGRPACNAVTAKLAPGLSVRFGEASFTLRGEIYAHPDSAVVVAGNHALNPRYSVVVYAGLGARATRQCIENLPNRGGEPTEVLLMPVGRPAKSFRSPPAPAAIAMP
jgi:hypothetical protein